MDTYTYPVVVSAVNVSGHAKVSDLYQQVLAYQAVPVGAATGVRHQLYSRYILAYQDEILKLYV